MKLVEPGALGADFYRPMDMEAVARVAGIIDDVRAGGDDAVRRYTELFDGVRLEKLRLSREELDEIRGGADGETVRTLEAAAARIRAFAERQMRQLAAFEVEQPEGVFVGQKVVPIDRVGVYAPGGKFPLASTVLMAAIPARVAGVGEIALFSPPGAGGRVHPAVIAAAGVAGVDEIYRVGGAQAVAAMAYGTQSIKAVAKIVGPGNRYVTAAKRLVFGRVGIDMLAGPSEVMIIADRSAEAAFLAADLLAQAEHDEDAEAVLVTDSRELAGRVLEQIDRQLEHLSTAATARASLERRGKVILVERLADAVAIANRKGPEHLELVVEKPDGIAGELRSYGTLFVGGFSPVVLGDYSSGLNHTLPTGGCAAYTSGLSVRDFLRCPTTLRVTRRGIEGIGPVARRFALLEGLDAHARSVAVRLEPDATRQGRKSGRPGSPTR
jgi:histidinol dehydrogenase